MKNQIVDEMLTPLAQTNGIEITVKPVSIPSYLVNPGMGLQYDQTMSVPIMGETVAYVPREDISWNILNPAEGVYDWYQLDYYLNQAIAQGKQFSFRVYTMRGEGYGGHRVPQWVLDKGANLFATGDPNYHNCTYQNEWGKFVDALRLRYDGNLHIAFIDISGYGAFNEWNWNDAFTQWDNSWETAYANGTAGPSAMSTMDSQSWRRLMDIFAGGAFNSHHCVNKQGKVQTDNYSYTGFQDTQLVMPYAGIKQANQYMISKELDVGFRYDCLGSIGGSNIMEKLGDEIAQIWPLAPIVFEFCNPMDFSSVEQLLKNSHASLVHSNKYVWDNQEIVMDFVMPIGYRYHLSEMTYLSEITVDTPWHVEMAWQNIGYAPSYPKMGQQFELHIFLSDLNGNYLANFQIETDISGWMPANSDASNPASNQVSLLIGLPQTITPGQYTISVSIIDQRTGLPINLAMEGRNSDRSYFIGKLIIEDYIVDD